LPTTKRDGVSNQLGSPASGDLLESNVGTGDKKAFPIN